MKASIKGRVSEFNFADHITKLDTLQIFSGPVLRRATSPNRGEMLCEFKGCKMHFRPDSGNYSGIGMPWKSSPAKSGRATYFRYTSDVSPLVLQGTVGKSGSDLNLNNIDLLEGFLLELGFFAIRTDRGGE